MILSGASTSKTRSTALVTAVAPGEANQPAARPDARSHCGAPDSFEQRPPDPLLLGRSLVRERGARGPGVHSAEPSASTARGETRAGSSMRPTASDNDPFRSNSVLRELAYSRHKYLPRPPRIDPFGHPVTTSNDAKGNQYFLKKVDLFLTSIELVSAIFLRMHECNTPKQKLFWVGEGQAMAGSKSVNMAQMGKGSSIESREIFAKLFNEKDPRNPEERKSAEEYAKLMAMVFCLQDRDANLRNYFFNREDTHLSRPGKFDHDNNFCTPLHPAEYSQTSFVLPSHIPHVRFVEDLVNMPQSDKPRLYRHFTSWQGNYSVRINTDFFRPSGVIESILSDPRSTYRAAVFAENIRGVLGMPESVKAQLFNPDLLANKLEQSDAPGRTSEVERRFRRHVRVLRAIFERHMKDLEDLIEPLELTKWSLRAVLNEHGIEYPRFNTNYLDAARVIESADQQGTTLNVMKKANKLSLVLDELDALAKTKKTNGEAAGDWMAGIEAARSVLDDVGTKFHETAWEGYGYTIENAAATLTRLHHDLASGLSREPAAAARAHIEELLTLCDVDRAASERLSVK